MSKKGICILVEAPDGAGKDTLIENICKNSKNKKFKIYKFPSGEFRTKIFERPRTQMELVPMFCDDFKQQISNIQKDIDNGINIIINRMYISTLLYSTENQVPESTVLYNIDKAISNWRPTLTVLVDIKPQEAFRRLASRNDEKNWLDGDFDKQIRINQLYKNFYKSDWKKLYDNRNDIIQVDSNGSKEETYKDFELKYKDWAKSKSNEIKR